MLTKLDFLFLIITLSSVAMAVVWATSSCLIKTEACSDEIVQNKTARRLRKRKVQLDDCHSTSASTTLEDESNESSSSERKKSEAEMSLQVKIETLRQLIRSIDTEIRDLKVYSKFAEAQRFSIKESCDKKIEKLEKEGNQICVDSIETNI